MSNIGNNQHLFANQKLTKAEKEKEFGSFEEWARISMLSILRTTVVRYGTAMYTGYNDQINYDLYNDILHEEDFTHVTEPYGKRIGNFPAKLQNYNIIKPKIDLLLGEEIKRPFNMRAVVTNPDAVSEIQEQKKNMLIEYLNQQLLMKMQEQGLPIQNEETGEIMTPKQIEEYMTHSYKDIRESVANKALTYLIKYHHIKEQFNDGFKDLLVAGKEFYWSGIINGEPVVRLVNPVYLRFDLSPDLKYLEDAQWVYEERYLTPSEIYDEFYDDLEDEDVDKIERMRMGTYTPVYASGDINAIGGFDVSMTSSLVPYRYDPSSNLIRVLHYEWKGLKKIGFLNYIDEQGIPQETIVDEDFKKSEFIKLHPNSFISLEWKWINCVYQGTQIAADIFCKIQEKPFQYWNIDNLSECKLSYTGVVYNKRNSKGNSLVEIMKPWQYLYNILMYRLELTFAKAKDKIFLMDIAQIPRSMGFSVEKWMYYMDALGIAFINSFEEGSGIGQGRASGFNQFKEVDLSLARVIDQYVMALERIKEEIGEISGVTRQRQGQVQSSELVGNVERTIVQSSHITEPLFEAHQNVKQRVLTNLLESAKVAWVNGKKAQYVLDDMSRVLFEIEGPELADSQMSVFLSSSSKDDKIIETLQSLAMDAVKNQQAKLSDVISIMESESIADMKAKLLKAEAKADQQAQAMEQQKLQVEQQIHAEEMQDKQADRDLENELNQRDNDTKILVEKMKIQQGMIEETPEGETNIVADIIELEKIKQKREEVSQKLGLESKKLSLEERKLMSQEYLAERKLDQDIMINEDKLKSSEKVIDKELKQENKLTDKDIKAAKEAQEKDIQAAKELEDIKGRLQLKVAKLRPKPTNNKK